ncbi:SAM-dependent methyltransferase [Taibaiella sp. KBW10]|uniref:class I SAM-dependent methyltransferase n=1 Tax=Taibaiella sp. KBW10 TaxID=2153357 RepID=UPI000F59531D|nr:class I SAM-dependent methyltransferase [Taibaiella sp. KBW10]RQO31952.1 SAM-dependent methyltransferase [Taibaiella sp. KBW10]
MEAFANRLQKNKKHLLKWAKRQGISCFRIYDHDIPEFPFCVDRYEDCVHISEYVHRYKMTEEEHEQWLIDAVSTVAEQLAVPGESIFLKERKILSRRVEQYEKVAVASKKIVVQESGLKFWVNLTDYLDTGLFLDHRPLRQLFQAESEGKKVLNLFAYTGSFSVYAAAAKAKSVTTVDLSNTYLNWAKENFELNGFAVQEGDFIQSDVMDFLKKAPETLYDLVIVDPPSFSNSKRMKGTWDTQRDHATMLHLLLQHVAKGGVVYFSNNFRNFTPDFTRLKVSSIAEITDKTIPEDFRNKKIHHCYKIVH